MKSDYEEGGKEDYDKDDFETEEKPRSVLGKGSPPNNNVKDIDLSHVSGHQNNTTDTSSL